jgi:hypothetical protein
MGTFYPWHKNSYFVNSDLDKSTTYMRTLMIYLYLTGVHPTSVHLMGGYLRRVSHLRVFLARRARVARILISTPRMVEKLLIVGDSAVRLLVTLGARSAW